MVVHHRIGGHDNITLVQPIGTNAVTNLGFPKEIIFYNLLNNKITMLDRPWPRVQAITEIMTLGLGYPRPIRFASQLYGMTYNWMPCSRKVGCSSFRKPFLIRGDNPGQ